MSARTITGVQGQPYGTSEKRTALIPPRLLGARRHRFPLVLTAALLVVAAMPGSVQQAVENGVRSEPANLLSTIMQQAQGVAASGARFVSDLRLLYQIAQLRDGLEPRATRTPPRTSSSQVGVGLAPPFSTSEIKVCNAAEATLPVQSKSRKTPL